MTSYPSNNGETNLVESGETVDEALDVIEALREDEPEGEPEASSPRGNASILETTGEGEDACVEEMYRAPQTEDEVTLRAARETFRFHGGEFTLYDMPQSSLVKPKRLWFRRGDLVFFTGFGLVRGNFAREDCARRGAMDKRRKVP